MRIFAFVLFLIAAIGAFGWPYELSLRTVAGLDSFGLFLFALPSPALLHSPELR